MCVRANYFQSSSEAINAEFACTRDGVKEPDRVGYNGEYSSDRQQSPNFRSDIAEVNFEIRLMWHPALSIVVIAHHLSDIREDEPMSYARKQSERPYGCFEQ